MPRKNAKAAAPTPTKPANEPTNEPRPAPAKPGANRPRVFGGIEVNGIPLPPEKLVLSYDQVRAIMGWETEEEYAARRVAEGLPKALITFGDDYLITDEYDKKVRCSHNSRNRPFDAALARAYRQDFLYQKFLLNGEAFIVDEFGDVISGQHRGAGFVLAVQAWRKDSYWRKFWPHEPVYQTVLVCGVAGTQELRATLDNTRPRQLSDTIFTSNTFDDLEYRDKKEASRMLDAAVDLLWRRTGAQFGQRMSRQTNQASHDFLARHPRLVEAVRHLFNQNKERAISLAKLSPGQCAALMYLMAASGTDGAAYRGADPPAEAQVDLRYWGKAKDFWSLFAGKGAALVPLINVLTKIVNGNFGTLELNDKKMAAIVRAWNGWVAGKKLTPETVGPECVELGTPECKLDPDRLPILGGGVANGRPVGIDLGCRPEVEEDEEDVERRKEELARKAAGTPAAAGAVAEALAHCRRIAANRVLLFANSEGGFTAFDGDADVLAAVLGGKTTPRPDGLRMAKAAGGTDVLSLASMLRIKGGRGVSVVAEDGKTITDLNPPIRPTPPPATAAAANGAAGGVATPPATAAKGRPANGGPANPAANPAPGGRGKIKLRPGNASA